MLENCGPRFHVYGELACQHNRIWAFYLASPPTHDIRLAFAGVHHPQCYQNHDVNAEAY
jgi:hypothetical protein